MTHRLLRALWTAAVRLTGPSRLTLWVEEPYIRSIHRRGKDYQLRWRYDGQGAVLEEVTPDGTQTIEPGALRERFPISIFSQKQINELASNPRGLLEIVDRSPNVDRAEWESRFATVKSQFLQLRGRKRELSRQLAEQQQLRATLGDVENDLRQYEEKGHGEVLKEYQKRSRQKNSLPGDRIHNELASGIRELADSVELSDFPTHLFDEEDETTAEMRSIHEQTASDLDEITGVLHGLADKVDLLKAQRTEKISAGKWSGGSRNRLHRCLCPARQVSVHY